MCARVLVFSADELRSKILNKVLDRNGFECLRFNRILEAGDAIARYSPEVVIFDTQSCFSEEIDHLKDICQSLKHSTAIVIGKEAVLDRFKRPLTRKALCFPDPFDPDLITEKIKKEVSQKKNKGIRAGSDMLEKTLKHLLHLE